MRHLDAQELTPVKDRNCFMFSIPLCFKQSKINKFVGPP